MATLMILSRSACSPRSGWSRANMSAAPMSTACRSAAVAAGGRGQRAGADPEQARRLHRLDADAGRAHQHRDPQHVAGPGVPDGALSALRRRQVHPQQARTIRAARGSDPGW